MAGITVEITTAPVRVTAKSSQAIKVEVVGVPPQTTEVQVVLRGPQGRPGNDATTLGDIDLGTFN